jgi:hypothetical protein
MLHRIDINFLIGGVFCDPWFVRGGATRRCPQDQSLHGARGDGAVQR